ncbi:MAG: hypothetical protein U5L45_17170 [Saprospiraceae bacterium]|nr:hypothetical protein [Saprospiraceae bacterium]
MLGIYAENAVGMTDFAVVDFNPPLQNRSSLWLCVTSISKNKRPC